MGGTPAVKMLREAMVGDEVERGGRHPQRHLQLHPDRDGGDRPRLRRGAGRGPARWATPRPIRPWTSAASTPRHKITILAALAFGCAPDLRRRRDRGHRRRSSCSTSAWPRTSATASSWWPAPCGRPAACRCACIRRWRRSTIPLAQAGGRAERALHRGPRIGRIFIQGPGAGAGPTAAAVAADIADVMTGARAPGVPGAGRPAEAVRAGRRRAARSAAPMCG